MGHGNCVWYICASFFLFAPHWFREFSSTCHESQIIKFNIKILRYHDRFPDVGRGIHAWRGVSYCSLFILALWIFPSESAMRKFLHFVMFLIFSPTQLFVRVQFWRISCRTLIYNNRCMLYSAQASPVTLVCVSSIIFLVYQGPIGVTFFFNISALVVWWVDGMWARLKESSTLGYKNNFSPVKIFCVTIFLESVNRVSRYNSISNRFAGIFSPK